MDTSLCFSSNSSGDSPTTDPHLLRALRAELGSNPNFSVMEAVFNIRTPVLRLRYSDPSNNDVAAVDVTQENSLAVQKSCILSAHIRMAQNSANAIRMVKTFAKARGIYGKLAGFPSGFGYSISLLYYVSLRADRDNPLLSPEQMFMGWLRFYHKEFDYRQEAASLRSGGRYAKT